MKFKQVLSLMLVLSTFLSLAPRFDQQNLDPQVLVEESAETGEEEGDELIVA